MPNICSNEIAFTGSAADINALRGILAPLEGKNFIELAKAFGVESNGDRGELVYVGEVTDLPDGKSELLVATETAWSPSMAIFYKLLAAKFPPVEFAWLGVERGCGVFETNSNGQARFGAEYYVSCYAGDYADEDELAKKFANAEFNESAYSADGLAAAFSKILGHEGDLESLIEELDERGAEDWLNIYRFEVVEDDVYAA